MLESPKNLIYKNDSVIVSLIDNKDDTYDILVQDAFFGTNLKAWRVLKEQDRWVIDNFQMKNNDFYTFEFVRWFVSWDSLDELLTEFQELTSNFMHFFPFPTNETN